MHSSEYNDDRMIIKRFRKKNRFLGNFEDRRDVPKSIIGTCIKQKIRKTGTSTATINLTANEISIFDFENKTEGEIRSILFPQF